MQNRDETIVEPAAHPLKSLTAAQFMALGGSAVAYVRPVKGAVLAEMLSEEGFDFGADYQLVMSADGTPLMVADTSEAVAEWLAERDLGVVAVH
jgi:hypothetical protein